MAPASQILQAIDLLIDMSPSMVGERYALVLKHLHEAILPTLRAEHAYGLCTIGSAPMGDGSLVHSLVVRVVDVALRPAEEFAGKVKQLPEQPSGSGCTPLADALLNSCEQLKEIKAQKRTIVVFSDGEENCSKSPLSNVYEMAKEMAIDIDWGGLQVFSVGIEKLPESLKELSSVTGGQTLTLSEIKSNDEKSNALKEFFVEINEPEPPKKHYPSPLEVAIEEIKTDSAGAIARLTNLEATIKGVDDKLQALLADRAKTDPADRLIRSLKTWLIALSGVNFMIYIIGLGFLLLVLEVRLSAIDKLIEKSVDLQRVQVEGAPK
jgi:hypothetical protein